MFQVLQEWEGYVIEIGEDDFTVRLLDLTAGSSHEEEEAVIPLSEISEDDFKHLRLGSIFRWVIGYERSTSGTKQRVSQIVFPRTSCCDQTGYSRSRGMGQEDRSGMVGLTAIEIAPEHNWEHSLKKGHS